MNVGIICGSFKPYTNGHNKLIKLASRENENVIVFVSLKDRKNKDDEVKIFGEDMKIIWDEYIIPFLPSNVNVIFTESPVRAVYNFLGEMNEKKSPFFYKVYSDPNNIVENFPISARDKYFGKLYKSGRLKFVSISRNETEEISGTEMRQFLKNGMKREFKHYLPEDCPDNEKEKIWFLFYGRFLKTKNPSERKITKDFTYGILPSFE